MLDPVTLYAAKIATTTSVGSAIATGGVMVAETAVTEIGSLVAGLSIITAGVWKLLSDHSAVERERETNQSRILALEAEIQKAAASEAAWREHARVVELEAARAGVSLPSSDRNLP